MARVLVIDDSEAFRNLLWRFLNDDGHEVVLAGDGVEALAALQMNDGIDVVLVDVNMPRMNGLSFLRKLQAEPALRQRPCVVISAESPAEAAEAARASGARAWLSKPVTPAQLRALLVRVLPAR